MLVLDTDILSILQRPQSSMNSALLERLRLSGEVAAVTVVSLEEQMRGWTSYCAKARSLDTYREATLRLKMAHEFFRDRLILDFDTAAAEQLRQLQRARIRVGLMDLRIAAIVLARQALLLTRNLRDFARVPGLRAEDWTAI